MGGVEGTGYNREHSWPQAWFGGGIPPMESDLFQLYPTDNFVNNQRGSFPYGEVDSPTWTSLNGSKLGPCSYPGYSGTAFEPIDGYKGDFARSYFYMTTRYYLEDGAWPGSDMTDGADLLPWAVDMLLEWHVEDPVSGAAQEVRPHWAVTAEGLGADARGSEDEILGAGGRHLYARRNGCGWKYSKHQL